MGIITNADWASGQITNLTSVFGKLPLILLISIVTVFLYFWLEKRHFYALAAKIPGPPTVPLFGNALAFISVDNAGLLERFLNLMQDYGETARVWLGPQLMVVISNPKDIEISLNSSKLIEKDANYTFFDDILGQGLLNASGDIWKKHRRIIAPTFHSSVLKHFVAVFDRQSRRLVQRLEKKTNDNFNVFPFVRDCSLDFITETALETTINAQDDTVSEPTLAAEKMMKIMYNRMFKVWLHPDQIFYRTEIGREYLRLRKIVQDATEPILKAKKDEISAEEAATLLSSADDTVEKRKSLFRLLVSLNEDGEKLNYKELRDEVMTIIITGYETTAATISFTLVMLGLHQESQEKVYEEVKAVEECLQGREMQADDLNQFPYMDRVVKETLRLFPVGPLIARKATADVPLATCTVPKGASLSILFFYTHRNPEIWDKPNKFNPDNFLPEEVSKRHPYSYNPFSAGPRGCIGQKYAQLSMRVMLFYIISRFRIHCDKNMDDIVVQNEVTLKMKDGFVIRLEPRK